MMPKKKSMSESWEIAIRKGYEGEILGGVILQSFNCKKMV